MRRTDRKRTEMCDMHLEKCSEHLRTEMEG